MTLPTLQSYAGRTVLALGAHPDDVEMGMGGTVAKLVALGARVIIGVVCVPGAFEQRRREAAAASAILGAELHVLCNEGPCRVEDLKNYELVRRLDALVEAVAPAALFAHSADDTHRDHRLVFEAFKASLRRGRMDAYCYQPCSCHPGPSPFRPRAFVDIGGTLEQKLAAVAAHRSQFASRGLDIGFLRDIARFYGYQARVTYAEGLEVIQLWLE